MKRQQLYRIFVPLCAVAAGDKHEVFARLPEGAVVTVIGPMQPSGLIDVDHSGVTHTVFYSDLRERSESVRAARS